MLFDECNLIDVRSLVDTTDASVAELYGTTTCQQPVMDLGPEGLATGR